MPDITTLGVRMKEYEHATRTFLEKKIPVILRLDGKAFHTYTKGFDKPYDEALIEDMQKTLIYLCENIQGAKCGYTQSDEITILLTDFDTEETSAWYDYNVEKITSVSASLATAKFNHLRFLRKLKSITTSNDISFKPEYNCIDFEDQLVKIKLAQFDSRAFQAPTPEEVVNNFLWRYRDAVKNSKAMLAQSLFSPAQLHKVNTDEMVTKCITEKNINWNDLDYSKKYGTFVIKNKYANGELVDDNYEQSKDDVVRNRWECVCPPDLNITEERQMILKYLVNFKTVYTLQQLLLELEKFKNLENNWDGYDAVPISEQCFNNCISILTGFESKLIGKITDIYPNPNATISIEFQTRSSMEIGDTEFNFFVRDKTDNTVLYYDNILIDSKLENLNLIKTNLE